MDDQTLGRGEAGEAIAIDIAALPTTNLGIIANPGAGKSQTIRKILELAAGGPQRIVLDVEDEFHTLREQVAGMLIAGTGGDCPARIENAAELARFLLQTGIDAVLQINDLGLEGQRLFIGRFLDALISTPTELWHPTLIVLDESHRFCPNGTRTSSSNAITNLVFQGRKRTFGAIFATPRLSELSTDVRGTLNNWLIGRASDDTDQTAACKRLGVKRQSPEAKSLPTMRTGHFWAIGPALTLERKLIAVLGVETTHLQPGQRNVPTPPAPERIREMLARLHVAEDANDATSSFPATNEGGKSDRVDVEAIRKAAYQAGYNSGYNYGGVAMREKIIEGALPRLEEIAKQIAIMIADPDASGVARQIDRSPVAEAQERITEPEGGAVPRIGIPRHQQPRRAPATASNGTLCPAARKMLPVIVAHEPVTWPEVGVLATMVTGNGYWYGGVKQLRESELIDEADGVIRTTKAADELVAARRISAEDIRDAWASRLKPPGGEMLRALFDAERPLSVSELSEAIGKKPGNGYWYGGVKAMRKAGLIEEDQGTITLMHLLRTER